MSKLLITIATTEIKPYCADFLENQSTYAKSRGYEYRIVTEKHWKELHPSFSKVYEIDRAFTEGWETVIWADADVLFMDQRIDLAYLLHDAIFMAAYQQGNWTAWKYLCAGLTVWKNCRRSRAFVAEWRERCEIGSPCVRPKERVLILHHPWEQWYFDEIIRETNYAGVRGCTASEIGCFCPEIWSDGTLWTVGMPTIHMAGPASWEMRAQVLPLYLGQVIC
jgi:hypothetical protein